MINAYRIKRTNSETLGKALIQDHLDDLAALAETHPATVSHAHFIKRDLAAAVEAGRCTVTMPHLMFTSLPGIPVVDVRRIDDSQGFILVTADGSQFKRFAKGCLAVTWHDFGDTWKKLTAPMRRALHVLACSPSLYTERGLGGEVKRIRKNTLRALESRRLVENGQLTPFALAMHRQHKQEFLSDGNQ